MSKVSRSNPMNKIVAAMQQDFRYEEPLVVLEPWSTSVHHTSNDWLHSDTPGPKEVFQDVRPPETTILCNKLPEIVSRGFSKQRVANGSTHVLCHKKLTKPNIKETKCQRKSPTTSQQQKTFNNFNASTTRRRPIDVTSYNDLVHELATVNSEYEKRKNTRIQYRDALLEGISHLRPENVKSQKAAIRFKTIKNEIDIFQERLDPFIFEMQTPREHQVGSSVCRHFLRMQEIQDMGIPIYSLGKYVQSENDQVRMARGSNPSFYRRIRRRNDGDFRDTDLIPRPPTLRAKARKDSMLRMLTAKNMPKQHTSCNDSEVMDIM